MTGAKSVKGVGFVMRAMIGKSWHAIRLMNSGCQGDKPYCSGIFSQIDYPDQPKTDENPPAVNPRRSGCAPPPRPCPRTGHCPAPRKRPPAPAAPVQAQSESTG